MPIKLSCACGKTLQVKDEFAGKRVRCPACQAVGEVPRPQAEQFDDFELLEDEPAPAPAAKPAKAAVKPQVVEDDDEEETPKPSGTKIKGVGAAPSSEAAAEEAKPKKKKKRKRSKESGLAAMYMSEARAEQERDEAARARASRDDESGGFTMFGVHVTAGVAGAIGMLITGIICIILLLIFKDEVGDPRVMIGAVVCTGLGLLTLVKLVLLGESED